MARIPKLFPEPDHEPERQAARTFDTIRTGIDPFRGKVVVDRTPEGGMTAYVSGYELDPWVAPEGEYPDFIPPMLHEAYDRAFRRDRGRGRDQDPNFVSNPDQSS